MTKTVSIDNATFDTNDFTNFLQRGLNILEQADEAKLDFKELVEEASEKTGLDKKIVGKFFKSRYADKAKEVAEEGATFAALIDAVDN